MNVSTSAFLAGLSLAALLGCSPSPERMDAQSPKPTNTFESVPPDLLDADDVELRVRVLEKQCFGSAGCSVEYRVEVSEITPIDIPDDASYLVTYEVEGPVSGPEIGSFYITGDEYEVPDTVVTDTESSAVELKVKVVTVIPEA